MFRDTRNYFGTFVAVYGMKVGHPSLSCDWCNIAIAIKDNIKKTAILIQLILINGLAHYIVFTALTWITK